MKRTEQIERAIKRAGLEDTMGAVELNKPVHGSRFHAYCQDKVGAIRYIYLVSHTINGMTTELARAHK